MVVQVEELDDIFASDGDGSLAFVFEDGEAGDGEVDGGFELGGLEFPAKDCIQLSSHGLISF